MRIKEEKLILDRVTKAKVEDKGAVLMCRKDRA